MRKFVIILVIAVLVLFTSGCNLIHFWGGKNEPSPSISEELPSETSAKPSPTEEPSPNEEQDDQSPDPTQTNDGHIFGDGGNFSDAGTQTSKPEVTVQDVQIQVYNDESLSSRDDVVFTDNTSVRADYDGDGTKDILDIEFSYDYPQSDEMNFPVKITLTIDGSSVVYEDTWNDGVCVGITDFDISDPELDIYILSLGTDVSAGVTTYWYDGQNVQAFTSFEIIEDTMFWYDTQGYIYYRGQYEDVYGVMVGLNFYTGEVFTVD